ncbi:MAG: nucleotidyltransferase family protein [Candidatus Odinarchaeia archaeon]
MLSKRRNEITKKYGVKKLIIFGSYTEGKQKETSDPDIIVEFEICPMRDKLIHEYFGINYKIIWENRDGRNTKT